MTEDIQLSYSICRELSINIFYFKKSIINIQGISNLNGKNRNLKNFIDKKISNYFNNTNSKQNSNDAENLSKIIDFHFNTFNIFMNRERKQIPIIKIFGQDTSGNLSKLINKKFNKKYVDLIQCCVNIHNYYPYFYILIENSDIEEYFISNRLDNKGSLRNFAYYIENSFLNYYSIASNQIIEKIEIVKKYNIYGYNECKNTFLKIYVYDDTYIKKLCLLFINKIINNKYYQPFEAHISYCLHFFKDCNLNGMDNIYFKYCYNKEKLSNIIQNNRYLNTSFCSFRYINSVFYNFKSSESNNNNSCYIIFNNLKKEAKCSIEIDICYKDILNLNKLEFKKKENKINEYNNIFFKNNLYNGYKIFDRNDISKIIQYNSNLKEYWYKEFENNRNYKGEAFLEYNTISNKNKNNVENNIIENIKINNDLLVSEMTINNIVRRKHKYIYENQNVNCFLKNQEYSYKKNIKTKKSTSERIIEKNKYKNNFTLLQCKDNYIFKLLFNYNLSFKLNLNEYFDLFLTNKYDFNLYVNETEKFLIRNVNYYTKNNKISDNIEILLEDNKDINIITLRNLYKNHLSLKNYLKNLKQMKVLFKNKLAYSKYVNIYKNKLIISKNNQNKLCYNSINSICFFTNLSTFIFAAKFLKCNSILKYYNEFVDLDISTLNTTLRYMSYLDKINIDYKLTKTNYLSNSVNNNKISEILPKHSNNLKAVNRFSKKKSREPCLTKAYIEVLCNSNNTNYTWGPETNDIISIYFNSYKNYIVDDKIVIICKKYIICDKNIKKRVLSDNTYCINFNLNEKKSNEIDDNYNSTKIFFEDNEISLIAKFCEIFLKTDPDIIIGYETYSGSIGFIINRANFLGIKIENILSRLDKKNVLTEELIIKLNNIKAKVDNNSFEESSTNKNYIKLNKNNFLKILFSEVDFYNNHINTKYSYFKNNLALQFLVKNKPLNKPLYSIHNNASIENFEKQIKIICKKDNIHKRKQCGNNSLYFDIINKQNIEIEGRIIINLKKIVKHEYPLNEYSLINVAKKILKINIPEINNLALYNMIFNNNNDDKNNEFIKEFSINYKFNMLNGYKSIFNVFKYIDQRVNVNIKLLEKIDYINKITEFTKSKFLIKF